MSNKLSVSKKKNVNRYSPMNINLKIPKTSLRPLASNGKTIRPLKTTSRLNVPKRRVVKKSYPSPLNVAYNTNNIERMNWRQLKRIYPNLNPTADADFDGLVNAKDCKPFDPSKDGLFSRFIGKVTGDKYGQSAEEYKAEKVFKSEQKTQKKEAIAEKKEFMLAAKIRKKEKEISQKVTSRGYAPMEKEMKKDFRAERLRELREKLKAKAKSMEKIVSPVEKVVKKMLPHKTYKTITRNGKKIRVAVMSGGILPFGKQKTAITKTVEKFAGVRGAEAKPRKTAKGQKGVGAGRPKGSYRYKDPRTGESIPAVEYHKLRKQLKRQAKTVETQAEVKQRFALARRGLSPEEVAQTQEEMNARMARLRALKMMKQQSVAEEDITAEDASTELERAAEISTQAQAVTQTSAISQEEQVHRGITPVVQRQRIPINNIQRVGHPGVPPGYRLQEDIMTGKKTLVAMPAPEAWTR